MMLLREKISGQELARKVFSLYDDFENLDVILIFFGVEEKKQLYTVIGTKLGENEQQMDDEGRVLENLQIEEKEFSLFENELKNFKIEIDRYDSVLLFEIEKKGF